MAIDLLNDRGTPLDRQVFTWRELAPPTYSKLNDDAFTRVRTILMNGIEADAIRVQHVLARLHGDLRLPLAKVRRVEQYQQTVVNWLNPADQSPLETTIGFEQVAIEVTASIAQNEPDGYLAQAYRFGLLEDFDHLYRYAALYDRLFGKDANYLTQNYTDILPGRPTSLEHRAPEDDLRKPYDRKRAEQVSKLNALTIVAGEHMTHDFYMTIGPMFSDPVARQLYAEIAAIEEQHVTHYESLLDPGQSALELWLLHEAMEVYNYWSCVESESNAHIKAIWERFLDYELGQVQYVAEQFKKIEKRDPAEVLDSKLPNPIRYVSHRDFVRQVLKDEVDLRTCGTEFVPESEESQASQAARAQLNAEGSPSEAVAAGWRWRAGTELSEGLATKLSERGETGREAAEEVHP